MSINRKEFFQKACLTGLCMCGFGSIISSLNNAKSRGTSVTEPEDINELPQEWIANLLSTLETELNKKDLRKIIKKNAIVHYNNLNMDKILSDYIGDIEGFIGFISDKWGWKIDYNKTTKIIIADENKNYCVCPMVNQKADIKPSAICYCSEGFAEKMFSTINGNSVKATVISSVIRGDKSCTYKIELG